MCREGLCVCIDLATCFDLIVLVRIAEATYRSVIRIARSVVRDIGHKAAASSGGLVELASINDSKSERDGHVLMAKKAKLTLPVCTTDLHVKGHKVPVLKLRHWASYLATANHLHILTGLRRPDYARQSAILEQFWCGFKKQFPDHEIFDRFAQGEVQPSATYPMVLHGDEGRGRRRLPVLITNYHGVIGRGTDASRKRRRSEGKAGPYVKLLPNLLGSSRTTRVLHSVVPKEVYQDEQVFNAILSDAAEDAQYMITEGVSGPQSGRVWMCVLYVCGDWAFLHKSGRLCRSFNNLPKRLPNSGNTIKLTGICHRCQAGQPGVPWEHVHKRSPAWLETLYVESAFTDVPSLCKLLHVPGREEQIWAFDVFHTLHLGILKNFVGSGLAVLSDTFDDTNIDDRFHTLTLHFQRWCKLNRKSSGLLRISKETIQWSTRSDYPVAGWFKGGYTTTVMEYLEDFLSSEIFSGDPFLRNICEAAAAMNSCLKSLYLSDLFIPPDEAVEIAEAGLKFLRRLAWLAKHAQDSHKCLFLLTPKAHAAHHILLEDLLLNARKGLSPLNPIALSVQMDEDYLGFAARLSRRVEPRKCSIRCIQRFLQQCYHEFVKAGLIIPRT